MYLYDSNADKFSLDDVFIIEKYKNISIDCKISFLFVVFISNFLLLALIGYFHVAWVHR